MSELLKAISPWLMGIMFFSLFFLVSGFIITFLISLLKGRIQVSKNQKIVYIVLLSLFFSSLIVEKYRTYFILNKIQSMLENDKVKIILDDGTILDNKQFFQDYLKMSDFKQSGSSPQDELNINITTLNETLTLNFKRDYREKKLYWVFYPSYRYKGSLGYLETKLLSN